MDNSCSTQEEPNKSNVFDNTNQSVTFYLHQEHSKLTNCDLIALKNEKELKNGTKCTIYFDGSKSFRELAEEKLGQLIDTPVSLVMFKVVSLSEEDEDGIDHSSLLRIIQSMSSYEEFRTKVEKTFSTFNNAIFITIVALPWSLQNNNFNWSSMWSYNQYCIEPKSANDLLSRAFISNREYHRMCTILLDEDRSLAPHTADAHIKEIGKMKFYLYRRYGVWVIPTITSIRFILHLLEMHGVSDIVALGVGNGLPECILANEAKRIGQPLTIRFGIW
jgi:hypothetical protein